VTTADGASAAHVEQTVVITTEEPIVVTELPIGAASAGDEQ
jgi:methionine aminopeptidase